MRRWNSDHSVVQAEGSIPGGDTFQNFSAMIFISVLLGLIDFSDVVGQIVVANKTLSVLTCLYYR